MQIIPVLDLKGGVAVHARCGQRDSYQPLNTPLCASSDSFDVVAAYLRLYPFMTLYIADLDALTGKAPQDDLIRSLKKSFPELDFWVDAGWPMTAERVGISVIGSESLADSTWEVVRRRPDPWILSLDFLNGEFIGPRRILEQPEDWPERVIHMNLSRVGSGQGPDFDGVRSLSRSISVGRIVVAGGVRNTDDLLALERLGVTQILVASALHSGGLTY